MVDSSALIAKVRKARLLVDEYETKKRRFDAMIQASKESTDPTEKQILLLWIDKVSQWLSSHKEEYERALVLTKIPESDLEQLAACDKAIYGG